MIFAVVFTDLLLVISTPDGYHQTFSLLVLFYLVPYLWIVTKERQQPPIAFVICVFLFLRLYSVVYLNASTDINLVGFGSDAGSYHIPRAKLLDGNYWSYIFKIGGDDYNGRLTHVLIANYIDILALFGLNAQYGNIHNIAFIANTLLCIGTLILYYKIVVEYSRSQLYGQRAVWFLALNPYFIGITSMPQKEALMFFGMALFAYSLVVKEKRYIFLMLSLFIISFERIYMTPLLVSIFVCLIWKFEIRKIFLLPKLKHVLSLFALLAAVSFIEWFIGIRTALNMAQTNQQNLVDLGGSSLPGSGFIINIIRVYFGPNGLRHFLPEYINIGVLALAHYALFPCYAYIGIKATLSPKAFGFALFATYVFCIILIPFHSSFKVFMVVFFGGLFLDKMFPIKNVHTQLMK